MGRPDFKSGEGQVVLGGFDSTLLHQSFHHNVPFMTTVSHILLYEQSCLVYQPAADDPEEVR